MKFSLIFCTLGRKEDVEVFFKSLIKQTYTNYEIIIIDQNDDDRVKLLYSKYKELFTESYYISSKEKGLSLSRNKGLKLASGNIICFPDDDCIYKNNTLENVVHIFNRNENLDVISGISTSQIEQLSNLTIKNEKLKIISYTNSFGNAISYTLFFKNIDERVTNLKFDECFGVGAKYGSTEETDFLFNFLNNGSMVCQDNNLQIYHPDKDETYNDTKRIISYSLGVGAFAYKHRRCSKFLLLKLMLLGPFFNIFRSLLSCNKKKIVWYFLLIKNRYIGFLSYMNDNK